MIQHHPAVVRRVAQKLHSIAAGALGEWNGLTDNQREEWEQEAVKVIDLAHSAPEDDIEFFDQNPADVHAEPLAVWHDSLGSPTVNGTFPDAANPSSLFVGDIGVGRSGSAAAILSRSLSNREREAVQADEAAEAETDKTA